MRLNQRTQKHNSPIRTQRQRITCIYTYVTIGHADVLQVNPEHPIPVNGWKRRRKRRRHTTLNSGNFKSFFDENSQRKCERARHMHTNTKPPPPPQMHARPFTENVCTEYSYMSFLCFSLLLLALLPHKQIEFIYDLNKFHCNTHTERQQTHACWHARTPARTEGAFTNNVMLCLDGQGMRSRARAPVDTRPHRLLLLLLKLGLSVRGGGDGQWRTDTYARIYTCT